MQTLFVLFTVTRKIELTPEHFRAIIFTSFDVDYLNNNASMNLIRLLVMKNHKKTTVYRWYTEFNGGHRSLADEFHEGRPKSIVVPENIDAVNELMLRDRRVTYREIEASLGTSGTIIHSILREHLAVKKI